MYKRLYNILPENQMLYSKQFGFQRGHSIEHAIMQLIDQISSIFEKNHFTLGVFIDLSKPFDTVYHNILITKLDNYDVNGNKLRWFPSYLRRVTRNFSGQERFLKIRALRQIFNQQHTKERPRREKFWRFFS